MEGLEEQVRKLNEEIADLHEDEIVALNQRDKGKAEEIEAKIEQLTFLRDHIRDELVSRKEEAAKPGCTDPLLSISYVSFWARPLSDEEVASVGFHGGTRNKQYGVTGFLLFTSEPGLFFQTIEGPEPAVDKLFERIQSDEQHKNVLLLLRERIETRRYPEWPMRTRRIADVDHAVHGPLLWLLSELVASYTLAHQYTPPQMRSSLLSGVNPLLKKGGRQEVVAAYVGVSTWTKAATVTELKDRLQDHKGIEVMHFATNVNTICRKHAHATGGICMPWLGNGMTLYWASPQQLNAALSTTVNIVQELNNEEITEYNVHIGLDSGTAVIVSAGELGSYLMPTAMGPIVQKAKQLQQEASRLDVWVLCGAGVYEVASKNAHNFKSVLETTMGEPCYTYSPRVGAFGLPQ
eukprot:TRINITY_DN56883_c0_g1_i1.p1 TRINITY_DN56883_c0_g1~~TRINITY_DN56883_c0_g1_i1.p1  ORF type:complete len:407 (-),score=16.35 TRINITY_DN56883_c0_g1_i1:271-1491(-)